MMTFSGFDAADSEGHASMLPAGKSKTLAWLASRVRTARIPTFVTTALGDTKTASSAFIEECRARFGDRLLAVRSDAHAEDGSTESHAGRFLSLCNVRCEALTDAIAKVAASTPGHPDDRVIVQAMVDDIVVAGVASTHRITDGAPWYCIEFAPRDNAAVTAGRAQVRQVAIARDQAMRAMDSDRLASRNVASSPR